MDRTAGLSRRAFGLGVVGTAAVTAAAVATGTVVLLDGDDVDPTGAADSSGGIQRRIDDAPDGAVIAIPAGAVLRCTSTITLGGTGKSLVGPGELRFTEGVDDAAALLVTGNGSRIAQVTVTNPNELIGTPDGRRSSGIDINAHDVTVTDCRVDRFNHGIVVAADGEWLGAQILGNRVTNVVGAGGGRGSDSPEGEDRGDGITVWGAQATVVGNVVSALPGTDARIGIHAEALGDGAEERPPHSDAMVTISGNVVTGPFRRSIVLEEIDSGTVVGNTCADATWWSIALISGSACLVADNTIRYSRTADDDQGYAYSPVRAAVQVYGGRGHVVRGNTVTVTGDADAFVVLTELGSPPEDALVSGNSCQVAEGGSCTRGVSMVGDRGPVRPRVTGNVFSGMSTAGIYLGGATSPDVEGNTVVGGAGCEHGVLGDAAANSGAAVLGNRIVDCGTGIGLFFVTSALVSANTTQGCATAIDLFESGGVVAVGNLSIGAGSAVANRGTNTVLPEPAG
ncbi:right-handed parallel beta-helix repeat-containing protein [Blastococcus haudaquaticus]|uniref:Right handed beta helix region n=1 Tax=Blastococcus haudaquaticus TaxID=1938745 RepID=A0A286GY55_9ACTN|nr:right-handed parallel beta-helix repeat-containing protein [Blastococcus haudaquaticus]SOE00421.1 Right handed beta helix region [Blastococcus haudaquaticus]